MRVIRPMLALGLLAVVARQAFAQEPYATLEVRGGYSSPMGTAKDQLKGQTSFGAGAAIALGSRLHLGVSVDWAHHSLRYVADANGTPTVPLTTCPGTGTCGVIGGAADHQLNVLHTFLKLSFSVVNSSKVTFDINAGPGFMVFSPNQNLKDATGQSTDGHFAVNAGAAMTYWFTDRIGVVLSPQVDIALKKTKGDVFTTTSGTIMPLTGGFRFKI